jgi:ABC-type branched-subunit amino acid transport system substrate-binding protein
MTIWVALAITALALGLAACGSDDSSTSGDSGGGGTIDLTIGNLVPLSGDLADFGPPGQKAAELAVAQIEDAIKEDGLDDTVDLQTEDDQTDDAAGVSAARKLSDAGASCIAGSWASSVTIPVARSVSIRDGILQISPASTSDEITGLEDDGLLNRTVPPDSFQGPTLADAIAKDLGGADGKTVNIGARNDAYGNGLADTFSAAWEDQGGTIGEKVIYDPEAATYNAEAAKITSGSPDATVIIDFPETFAKVGPALVRTGDYDPTTTWGTDGLASSSLPKDVGKEATEGFRGTAPGSPDDDTASQAFGKLWDSTDISPDVDRQTFDAQNFDATMLCYLSAVAAGSTDGAAMADKVREISAPPGDKYSFEELPDLIKALQNGDDVDYQGASGAIDMNDAGDATAGVYDVYEYKNGEINQQVEEVPVDTGE